MMDTPVGGDEKKGMAVGVRGEISWVWEGGAIHDVENAVAVVVRLTPIR